MVSNSRAAFADPAPKAPRQAPDARAPSPAEVERVRTFLTEAQTRLDAALGEIAGSKRSIDADWTAQGLRALFDEIRRLSANGSRIEALYAQAIVLRAQCDRAYSALADRWQDEYDAAVVRESGRLGGMGWSERESFYRLAVLDSLRQKRELGKMFDIIKAQTAAIEAHARAGVRLRQDADGLQRLVGTGGHLKEF